jgi:hypothetical protein
MPIPGIDYLAGLGSDFQSVLISGVVQFDLKNLKDQDFPFAEYSENVSRYKVAVSWFTGNALEPGALLHFCFNQDGANDGAPAIGLFLGVVSVAGDES